MPEDLPVTKCINAMVGITWSKVIFAIILLDFFDFLGYDQQNAVLQLVANIVSWHKLTHYFELNPCQLVRTSLIGVVLQVTRLTLWRKPLGATCGGSPTGFGSAVGPLFFPHGWNDWWSIFWWLKWSIKIYLFCTLGFWDKTLASSIYIVVFGHT
jgi:hypothetical protein